MTKPLVEKTIEKLLHLIIERQYEVGDKLPNEYELAEDLSVGRSTVREAVRGLVVRNILEVRQGSGTYISSKQGISEDPFGFALIRDRTKLTVDLFELRYLLEPRIAERVAQFATDEEIERLEEIVNAIEKALAKGDMKHLELDVEFHSMLAEMSRNIGMKTIIPVINQSIHLINENYSDRHMKETSVQSHRNILWAIKQRNPIAAYDSMLGHISEVRQTVLKEWFDKDLT